MKRGDLTAAFRVAEGCLPASVYSLLRRSPLPSPRDASPVEQSAPT